MVHKVANGTTPRGFESKLGAAADALRDSMDPAEYNHVALGLTFRRYISAAFETKHADLEMQRARGANPEDSDEFRAAGIPWIPNICRGHSHNCSSQRHTKRGCNDNGFSCERLRLLA